MAASNTTKKTPANKATAPAKIAAPPNGRQPVTPDAQITKWIKAELPHNPEASAAGLLRTWREQGGKANPRRFASLVAAARG